MTRCKLFNNLVLFMVVVPIMACSVFFSSCSSVPTGRMRIIDTQTGKESAKGQKQIQNRPFLLGIIPMFWTTWENETTKIDRIVGEIRGPIKLANRISLWATLILGAIAVSVQTPPFNTISRRGAYATAVVYGGSVALLFALGLLVEFWWLFLIITILALAYMLKDKGIDLRKLWKPQQQRDRHDRRPPTPMSDSE